MKVALFLTLTRPFPVLKQVLHFLQKNKYKMEMGMVMVIEMVIWVTG